MVTGISKTIPIARVDDYFGVEGKDPNKRLVVNKQGGLGYRELTRGEKIKAFFGCGPAALKNIVKACVKNNDYSADLAFLVEKHNAKWFKKTIVYCEIADQARENPTFKGQLEKIVNAEFVKKSDKKAKELFAQKIGGVDFSKSGTKLP